MMYKGAFLILLLGINLSVFSQDYDLIIRNGRLYQGENNTFLKGDIAVNDRKIVYIGDLKDKRASHEIDAAGLTVSSGFIDLHAHIEPIETLPDALSSLTQGVTTVLGGPDGMSPFPLKAHFDQLETMKLGVNVAYLVGHNKIRKEVMGLADRKATKVELETMKSMVAQAMEEGAFGLSTGLKYLPGVFSDIDELVELSKIAAQYNGFYTSHLREEGLGLISAVKEAIAIGSRADIPIVLTHHKVVGKPSWGASVRTLAMIDSANARGQDVQLDQYPYTASRTSLSILIPAWSLEGGQEMFLKRINDARLRDSIKLGTIHNILTDRGAGDIARVQFSDAKWNPELNGKSLADWAAMKKLEASPENGADLVILAQSNGGASMIFHAMEEEDVVRIMKHPKTMIASDGTLSTPGGKDSPHPRSYGTFPRVLGKYVRDEKVLDLETALQKMTYLPASRLGLKDRGLIKEGYVADLVIFDPRTVNDASTFSEPHQYAKGIIHVIVNGKTSISDGKVIDATNGEVLRKKR